MDLVNFIGSFVVLVGAILGIFFSLFVAYLYFSGISDKTSFNLICVTRAFNNIFVLIFNFLLLAFPVLLLSQNFYSLTVETVITVATINIYMVNSYHCVLVGANRFIAMFFPLYYSKLCGNKVTSVILAVFYLERLFAIFSKLYSLITNDCKVYMSVQTYGTKYENSTCSKALQDGFDGPLIVLIPLGIFGFTVLMNLATFAKILTFYLGNQSMDAENKVSVKNNIRLFFQTVLQDSLFFLDVLFTFQLSSLSDQRVWLFVSTVLVWEFIHMLDGFIMLMFSNRLSILKSMFMMRPSNVVGDRGNSDFQGGRSSKSLPDVA